jgi:hypothetical protein
VRRPRPRRRALAATLVLAAAAAISPVAHAGGAGATGTVPVVRCSTLFGTTGARRPVPHSVRVHAPQPLSGLEAYTNTEVYLLGPEHLDCRGLVAADGNEQLALWPRGSREPGRHSRSAALTLSMVPACAGCRAQLGCPFLRALARRLKLPCRDGIPRGELFARVNANLVRFEDPSGVAGTGWPSGGPDPARGVVGEAAGGTVFKATCTLPASQEPVCVRSIDDLLARYG